ncbi:MAG: leucine-rich repeat domain-containing protein [Oscillospiraceae bacterium]|nr:leucine-rich repeat domain-containing protein [Oscillospiraceae bacterium]
MFKRIISLLLAVLFCFSSLSMAVFADQPATEPIELSEEFIAVEDTESSAEEEPVLTEPEEEEPPVEEPAEEPSAEEESDIELLAYDLENGHVASEFVYDLWKAVTAAVGKSDVESYLTNEEIARVTEISIVSYFSYDCMPSLKGLDVLTNLKTLRINGMDFNFGDFFGPGTETLEGLTNLEEIYLNDNNLTEMPDLSALTKLKALDLTGNQIPASEITADKLPASFLENNPYWIESTTQKQLLGDISYSVEPVYYAIGNDRPFFVTFNNLRNCRDYELTVQYTNTKTHITNNARTTANNVTDNEYTFVFEDCGAEAGTYEAYFYLETDNGRIVEEFDTFTFEFVDDIPYVETEEADWGQHGFSLHFVIPEAFDVDNGTIHYELISQGEKPRYYATTVSSDPNVYDNDRRYGSDSEGSFKLWWAKTTEFYPYIETRNQMQLPAGNYDMIVVQEEPYIYCKVENVLSVPEGPGGGNIPGGGGNTPGGDNDLGIPNRIALNAYNLTLEQGECFQMEAYDYIDLTDTVDWGWHSNYTAIMVDPNGLVYAEEPGTGYVLAIGDDNTVLAVCKVTVLPADAVRPTISDVSVSSFEYIESEDFYIGNYNTYEGTITFAVDHSTKLPTVKSSNTNAIALGKVVDNNDGTYTVPYTIKGGDEDTEITITAYNGTASNDYYLVMYVAIEEPVVAVTEVTGFAPAEDPEGFYDIFFSGNPQSGNITFTVENYDFMPILKSSNKDFVLGNVVDNGDDSFTVPYTIKNIGRTEIFIKGQNGHLVTNLIFGMEAVADHPNMVITGLSGFTMNMDEDCHDGVLQTGSGVLNFTVSNYTKLPTVVSSNPKVLALGKVKDEGNGRFSVPYTMKSEGEAIISLTAINYDKIDDQYIPIRIKDANPSVSTKNLTINGWLIRDESEKATFRIDFNPDFPIIGQPVLSGKGAENFAVEQLDSGDYLATIAENVESVKKGSYKLNLEVTTEGTADNITHSFPLTIKVEEPAIKISAKQAAKLNYFYLDALSKLNITLPKNIADIVDIELVDCDFALTYDDADVINVDNISLVPVFENGIPKKPDTAGILKIWLEGYRKPIEIKFSVSAEKKAPAVALTSKAGVFYPSANINEATFGFIVNKVPYTPDGETVVALQGTDNYILGGQYGDDIFFITRNEEALDKSSKASIYLRDPNWAEPVLIPYSMSVKTGSPALALVGKAIQLNGHKDLYSFETGCIELAWKDATNAIAQQNISVAPADSKAAESGVVVTVEGNKLVAKLTKPTAKGSYKFSVSVTAGEATSTTSLTVKVVEADATKAATIAAKGTIDVLNRENTSMAITAALKSVNGTISGVSLQGNDADKFVVVEENGKLLLKAKPDAQLLTKTNYSVIPVLTLTNAEDSTMNLEGKALTIKVTQGKPKLTVSPAKPAVDLNSDGFKLDFEATLKNAPNPAIGSIEQLNLTDAFTYNSETGILSFAENATAVKGKKYTLQFAVTYADQAANEKPVVFKYTVSVNK